ncbi:MAG: GAF domain-containing protein, partial [Planctomycetota bacterium]
SAQRSPIASVVEVWAPDPETRALRVVSADYGPYVDLEPVSRSLRLGDGEGLAGRVLADGGPLLTADLAGVESMRGDAFLDYGFEWCFGLPVYVGDELFGVVTFLR